MDKKLGRKIADTWNKPRNKIVKRIANKGIRKNAKLSLLKYEK